jgi:hypothetical protein
MDGSSQLELKHPDSPPSPAKEFGGSSFRDRMQTVLFEVNGGVKKAFRVPAELRVYYTSSGREETARATLVGEPLKAQAP